MKDLESSRVCPRFFFYALILVILAVVATATPALACYNVTIHSYGSARGSWSGGNPDVWTPNDMSGWVNVGEVEERLSAGTSVTISTTCPDGGQAGDLWVEAPIRWTTGATLTLFAHSEVKIDASIAATGAAAGLVITSLGGSAAGYTLGNGHTVTLSGAASSLVVGGHPYVWVSDIGALQAMSPGGYYALKGDIDASATAGWNGGAGFVPLGNDSTPFSGVFDGLGRTITGLAIHRPGTDRVGFFGTCSTGTLCHVRLDGGTVTGNRYVGGLVGATNGAVQGCSFTGTVTGASNVGGLAGYANSIRDSYTAGQVNGGQNAAGGLAAYGALIDSCYSTASVTGGSPVGGLVADGSYSTITHSYSSGPVAADQSGGGLVGYSDNADIRDSYSTSPVTGTPGESYGIGGLVGYNTGPITRCFSSGPVSGSGPFAQVGGLVGINSGGSTTNCYWDTGTSGQTSSAGGTGLATDDAMVSASYAGWDFNTWYLWEGATRPFLLSEWTTAIANAHQLQLMTTRSGGGEFTLVRDIEMGELARASGMWKPAIGFLPTWLDGSCTLDGAGHTISGLIVHGQGTGGAAGLFINSQGTIRNLGLVSASVTGISEVGALVGFNDGAIANCYATGSVTGQTMVGGLVGVNDPPSGTVTNSASACTVTGDQHVGGLAGLNYGGVTNSYGAGPVTGSSGVGGLVGYNYGTVSNSFWDTVTTGQAHSSGSADFFGLTTAQMMQLDAFAGAAWDIDAVGGTGRVWRIYGSHTYPFLRGFLKPLTATAANDVRPYTGVGYSGGNGVAFSPANYDASNVFGTGIYGGSSQGAIAPGSYAITPDAWSNQQGYDISAVSGTLTIAPGPGVGRVPDGITGAPLQISNNLAQLDLTWGAGCGAAATDYAVYEGTIGSWASHSSLVCSTSGTRSATVTPSAGNHYYLIVPVSTTQEGSYGTDSTGAEIPQSSSPCKASQDLSGCL
jgi:hypothetical protein